jgi:hypothetical protein
MKTRFVILILLSAAMIGLCACPYVAVHPKNLHPDATSSVIVQAQLVNAQPKDTRVRVNNIELKHCQSENPCETPSGSYPTASNSSIKLDVDSIAVNGKMYRATRQWPIINCTNHWTYTAPTQIPNSLATQTGPNLYQLSDPVVAQAAQDALLEFANNHGMAVTDIDTADELVAAVAEFVDNHMTWTADDVKVNGVWVDGPNKTCINTVHQLNYQPGWDFPIPANYTISYTGAARCNCPTDYCGDCEDHAILRAALLRALGFAPECIWDTIDRDPATGAISHEYNVVIYEGAFRLMDYGPISSWLATHTWNSHRSYYGWNEVHGPRGTSASNHTDLTTDAVNYRLHSNIVKDTPNDCQKNPDFYNYYKDTCP